MESIQARLSGDEGSCCGCGCCMHACPAGAIEMRDDPKGFLFPQVDEALCVKCGKCISSCDFKNPRTSVDPTLERAVFAAKIADSDSLRRSTSGGAAHALSKAMVADGGVVYGCVATPTFDARHVRVDDIVGLEKLRGTKYTQSDFAVVFETLDADLTAGKRVLLIGTPCQVAAANKRFSKFRGNGLVTCELVCHGVCAPVTLSDHIRFLEGRHGGKVVKYEHRPKDYGWGGQFEKATFADGSFEQDTVDIDAWKQVFHSRMAFRPSCYRCPYASFPRVGDLTIGDFWGIKSASSQELVTFYDRNGVSLVLANTDTGFQLLESSGLVCCEAQLSDAVGANPNLVRTTQAPEGEHSPEAFWGYYFRYGYERTVKHYGWLSPYRRFRKILGRIRHKMKRR